MKKFFIFSIVLVASIITASTYSMAYAEDPEPSLMAQRVSDEEVLPDGTIAGGEFSEPAGATSKIGMSKSKRGPNYYKNTETLQLRFDGYIQFNPSYKNKQSDYDSYQLKVGRQVKQAWIDYRRKGKTVVGGAKWTNHAHSKKSKIYSAKASCFDDLLVYGDAGRTTFHFEWFYFSK